MFRLVYTKFSEELQFSLYEMIFILFCVVVSCQVTVACNVDIQVLIISQTGAGKVAAALHTRRPRVSCFQSNQKQ